MASVFTFDPEPPKLSSPWGSFPARPMTPLDPSCGGGEKIVQKSSSSHTLAGIRAPPPITLAQCGVAHLEAEPQEGPTEYKLHLLLRPRRPYRAIQASDDSADLKPAHSARPVPERSAVSEPAHRPQNPAASPTLASPPTAQTRQDRLQHLTTQLLWRLQQSSPYHSASTVHLVIPRLPEATSRLGVPLHPDKLVAGLESSSGALYEIGVCDDGTFMGLTEDEMDESLTNLRAMAASLGCDVEILRLVIVGDCERIPIEIDMQYDSHLHTEHLFVVEALVFPESGPRSFEERNLGIASLQPSSPGHSDSRLTTTPPAVEISQTEQLRVSLTGRTTAGKSSLIGTMSTSTLDNGRGKSRLSLLKHRHEIATGITSSVAPELIGYSASREKKKLSEVVLNYDSGNIASWDDIHNASHGGRIVFLTDSAGHLRYRRTIVRGLVSWAPHWTLCCIPADEILRDGVSTVGNSVAARHTDVEDFTHSSLGHLGLCLKLGLQLIVVITKQDRATRDGLRQCLSGVLSMIKAYDRKPHLIIRPNLTHTEPQVISVEDETAAKKAFAEPDVVPIILSSAVSGAGIGLLHALLRNAPIPRLRRPKDKTPSVLFHIDELYSISGGNADDEPGNPRNPVIVSGHLHYGQLTVGDAVQIGPFLAEVPRDMTKHITSSMTRVRSSPSFLSSSPLPRLSRSMPRSEQIDTYTPLPSTPVPPPFQGEFFPARIVSIRNLRLPLRTLLQDQAGTIGLEFPRQQQFLSTKLRKGMVLARTSISGPTSVAKGLNASLRSCVSIQVRFNEEDYEIMEPGAIFNVYIASVRAVAKILTVEAVSDSYNPFLSTLFTTTTASQTIPTLSNQTKDIASAGEGAFGDLEDGFGEFDIRDDEETAFGRRMIDVVFNFIYNPEWIEEGARVLAMPGQAIAGGFGLDGFVGYVMETRE